MSARPRHHIRRNLVWYIAIFLALGGGYAIAATSPKTIRACVVKKTGELLVKARCSRGQSRLDWNQQGPQGQSPVTAWAAVQANGFTGAGARGISVQHVSTGTYNVTATPSECTQVADAPTVTVDAAPPTGAPPAGAFPVAWETFTRRNTFTVSTGVVVGGSFTPTDEAFNVQLPCS
jgi:hypothetical protein